MESKENFKIFIDMVEPPQKDFVTQLHNYLEQNGCKVELKPAKYGCVASYIIIKAKKTVLNFVFRKSGIFIRIYANNVHEYAEFLNTLPSGMKDTIRAAQHCKRMLNPDDCNSKCAMGFDFVMDGEHLQKCRNGAFLFMLTEVNNPYIKDFVSHEMQSRQK